MVAERCGGNPFYINAVVRRAGMLGTPLVDEEAINTVLAFDISSGFIWGELYEQVQTWVERINEYGITKWILYLSALDEDDGDNRISLERIQRELKRRDGQTVSIEQIRDVLVRLSRGDLLDYLELGGWFRKIDDPILLEFLKIWGRIEVEGQNVADVQVELVDRYRLLDRRLAEYQGYLAEVFMGQVLLSSQDKSKLPLPGAFFKLARRHSDELALELCPSSHAVRRWQRARDRSAGRHWHRQVGLPKQMGDDSKDRGGCAQ